MKILSLLFSLLLGAAVILFFLQPWDTIEKMMGTTGPREAAPPKPSTTPEPTATVETAPARPPQAAPPQPEAPPPEAPKAAEPADPKTHMLAAEKAEAERSAALQQKAVTPAPRETKRYFKVTVLDNATLEAGLANDKVVIRLEGIAARSPDESCKTGSGKTWPCGAKARAALTQLIRSRAVTCTLPPGGETSDFVSRCSVMDQDLSTWLVRRGWATPQVGAEEFAKALDAAKSEKLGLWQGE
jgi:endonuclease YncB( thermonuclease family)